MIYSIPNFFFACTFYNFLALCKVTDAVIVLDEVGTNVFQKILEKEGVQRSLSSNIWLIHSKKSSVSDYFSNIRFRFGLNVLIFSISTTSNNSMFVTQIIGNGVSQVSYKVLVTKKYLCEVMIIESSL